MTKKGYKQTKEHIQKRIKMGWNHLEETKRKISESHKRLFVEGRLKPSRYWKGKKIFFTDEHLDSKNWIYTEMLSIFLFVGISLYFIISYPEEPYDFYFLIILGIMSILFGFLMEFWLDKRSNTKDKLGNKGGRRK